MKPCRRLLLLVVVLSGMGLVAVARERSVEVIPLTIHPAPPPTAALAHRLLPPCLDQTPGNAALLYSKAFLLLARTPTDEPTWDKVTRWLELPPEELPCEDVRGTLERFHDAMYYADLAARRARCDWDLPIREEENVYGMLLPELSSARSMALVIALRTRLKIAELLEMDRELHELHERLGELPPDVPAEHPVAMLHATARRRFDEALRSLQTGYALARHVARQPTFISGLVGSAIMTVTTDQLEALVQLPRVPNLYWAITAMPRPLIDMRGGIEFEAAGVYLAFPEFQQARHGEHSPEQWEAMFGRIVAKYASLAGLLEGEKPKEGLDPRALLGKAYPTARRELIERGFPHREVDAMPPAQAVILHALETYIELRDEHFKWFYVPYWQARPGILETEARLKAAGKRREVLPLASLLVPSMSAIHLSVAGRQRRMAALRCVEAVRMFAATHEGALPESLHDVAVPIPINPLTGEPFPYRLDGEIAVLVAEGPAKSKPVEYHIRLAPPPPERP